MHCGSSVLRSEVSTVTPTAMQHGGEDSKDGVSVLLRLTVCSPHSDRYQMENPLRHSRVVTVHVNPQ